MVEAREVHVLRAEHTHAKRYMQTSEEFHSAHYVDLGKLCCPVELSARLSPDHASLAWALLCGAALNAYRDLYFKNVNLGGTHDGDDDGGCMVHEGGRVQAAVDSILTTLVGSKDEALALGSSRNPYSTVVPPSSPSPSSSTSHSPSSSSSSSLLARRFYMAESSNVKRKGELMSAENILSLDVPRSTNKSTISCVFLLCARDSRLSNEVEASMPWAFSRVLQMSKDQYNKARKEVLQGARGDAKRTAAYRDSLNAHEWDSAAWAIARERISSTSAKTGLVVDVDEALPVLRAALNMQESRLSDHVAAMTGSEDVLPVYGPVSYSFQEAVRSDLGGYAEQVLCPVTRKRARKAALLAQSNLAEVEKLESNSVQGVSAPTEVQPVSRLSFVESNINACADGDVNANAPVEVELAGIAMTMAASNTTSTSTDQGKYRCGRCGQIKANHLCPFLYDSGTPVETVTTREHTQWETVPPHGVLHKLVAEMTACADANTTSASSSGTKMLERANSSVPTAIWLALEEIVKARLVEWRRTGALLPDTALSKEVLRLETAFQAQGSAPSLTEAALRDSATVLFGPEERICKAIKLEPSTFTRFLKFQVAKAKKVVDLSAR
jgi:hypothetical protein